MSLMAQSMQREPFGWPTSQIAPSFPLSGLEALLDVGQTTPTSVTNYFLQSRTLDNASWTKTNITAPANNATVLAPDGAAAAERLVETATTSEHLLEQTFSSPPVRTLHCMSIYAKAGEVTKLRLRAVYSNGNYDTAVTFDLTNGLTSQAVYGMPWWEYGCEPHPTAAGWYRCWMSFVTPNANPISGLLLRFQFVNSSGAQNYLGNTANGLYAWQAQLERNVRRPSTPVVTTTASVTRGGNSGVLYNSVTPNSGALMHDYDATISGLTLNGSLGRRTPQDYYNASGSASYLTIPQSTPAFNKFANGTGDWSMMFLFYQPSVATIRLLTHSGTGGAAWSGVSAGVVASNTGQLQVWSNNNAAESTVTSPSVLKPGWNCAIIGGSSSTSGLNSFMFINGQIAHRFNNAIVNRNRNGNIALGRYYDNVADYVLPANYRFGLWALWNRRLSEDEARYAYDAVRLRYLLGGM